mgnify:CR=1 FL=1
MIEASGVDNGVYWARVRPEPWHPKHHEIIDWCLDTFGIDGPHNWHYITLANKFQFTKEEHLILFALRWS